MTGPAALKAAGAVSVLIPQLTPTLVMETIESVVHGLSSAGCVVIIGVTAFDQVRPELIMAALAYRARAIIVTGEINPEVRQFIRQSSTTAIEIWDLPDDHIDIDGAKIAQKALEVLEKRARMESLDTQLFDTGFKLIQRASA